MSLQFFSNFKNLQNWINLNNILIKNTKTLMWSAKMIRKLFVSAFSFYIELTNNIRTDDFHTSHSRMPMRTFESSRSWIKGPHERNFKPTSPALMQ